METDIIYKDDMEIWTDDPGMFYWRVYSRSRERWAKLRAMGLKPAAWYWAKDGKLEAADFRCNVVTVKKLSVKPNEMATGLFKPI